MPSGYFSRVIVIPSAVFLAALFGGAYGSGREIVEFITRHGALGGLFTIVLVALIYSTCMFLVYELARVFRAFEIRAFADRLLGKAKFVYEILITLGLLLALAICAAAGGAIAESHFGLPELAGGAGVLVIIIVLTFFGRKIVEDSMIASVSALGGLLLYLVFVAVSQHRHEIAAAFSSSQLTFGGLGTGAKYALSSCGFLTLLLYSVTDLRSRKETAVTAVTAGIVGVIPAIAFHFAFMMAYPGIVDEKLPTYTLFERIMPGSFLTIYVIVVFVLVAQTGVALLQGVVESLDKFMTDRRGTPMSRVGHATVAGLALVAASAFASIGIVELIVRVFDFLSAAFFIVFFVPLFTRGVWLIWRHPGPYRRSES